MHRYPAYSCCVERALAKTTGGCVEATLETKGQVDKDVPLKSRAAIEWSKGASWEYVFVLEGVFHRFHGSEFSQLVKACGPALRDLVDGEKYARDLPLFAGQGLLDDKAPVVQSVVSESLLTGLPDRLKCAADEVISLYRFFESLDYALNDSTKIGGIFDTMKSFLRFSGGRELLDQVRLHLAVTPR